MCVCVSIDEEIVGRIQFGLGSCDLLFLELSCETRVLT